MTPTKPIHPTREAYLLAAVELFKPAFETAGAPIPPVRVSTGWPSSRATTKRKALGEAWSKSASADGVVQIFISPWLADPRHNETPAPGSPTGDLQGVLSVLAHELVHAAVGNEAKHGPLFRKVAVAVGMEGKMTATTSGPKLVSLIESMIPQLGEYPHSKIDPTLRGGAKKQGTRMIKCECAECQYVVRTTRKWLELGAPRCPSNHGPMAYELPDEDGGTDEGND